VTQLGALILKYFTRANIDSLYRFRRFDFPVKVMSGRGQKPHEKQIFRFRQFLKDVSKIPLSVGGEFDSSEKPEVEIFEESDKINVNDFLETMMSDPGPQCLSWLLVLHRVANAENSRHAVTCGSCGKQNFRGLRYKSEKANYHLCQVSLRLNLRPLLFIQLL